MFNNNPNKPPGFPLPQPGTEQDPSIWNSSEMPWTSQKESTAHAVMLFNGMNLNHDNPDQTPGPSTSFIRQPRVKRKSESDDFIPTKHFISEEKMVAHMNGLHLSDNFQQHNVTPEPTEPTTSKTSETAHHVNLSREELEKRLKRAQRIIVCDQVKKTLKEEKEILNRMIINRMDPPCRALVLWKPPPSIEKLLVNYDNASASIQEEESEDDMEDDNNNNNNDDPNNNMDDVMME